MTGAEILAVASIAQGIQGFVAGNANAKAANANAAAVTAQTAEEERRFRVQAMQRAGTATVNAAGQGAGLDALDILSSNAATEELDALTLRYGGAVKAANYKNQANQAKSGAMGSLIGGFVGAGSNLYGTSALSSAGSSNIFGSQGPISRAVSGGTYGPIQSWGGF